MYCRTLDKLDTVRRLGLNASVLVIWKDKDERLTDMPKVVLGGGCFLLDQYGNGLEYFTSEGQMTAEVKSSLTLIIVKKALNYVCRRNMSKI